MNEMVECSEFVLSFQLHRYYTKSGALAIFYNVK